MADGFCGAPANLSPAFHGMISELPTMLFAAEMFAGLEAYGYVGIIAYMILTGCGLPTPEEVAIIGAGVASAAEKLDWRLSLASLLIGALAGDCVMYFIGYHFGQRLLQKNRLWNRLITPEREKRVEGLLAQHGVKVLLGARFLPGIRGPMYITAGILKVPFKRFVVADLFCASLVVSIFFGLSYLYGGQVVRAIREGEGWLTTIVLTVAVIVGGIGLIMYLRKQRVLKIGAGITPDQPTITNASQSTLTDDSHSSAANRNGQIGTEQANLAAAEKTASAAEKARPPGN